jgi:hypothetical protein
MRRQNKARIIAAAMSLTLIDGCKPSSRLPQAVNAVYGKIELGMPLDEARALVNSAGEERSYDNLPADPRPRRIYSKLPAGMECRVWAATGKPTLILGVVNDKVAFSQILWLEGGEFKSDSIALPAYQ